jgi:hypothetical protein
MARENTCMEFTIRLYAGELYLGGGASVLVFVLSGLRI